MRQFYLPTAILSLAIFWASSLFGQGAIINEFSNGPSGTQEYFELVVIGPSGNENCGPVDIREFIVDDNNGDFACGPRTSRGIAAGHIRFRNQAVWSAVPAGSIIVLYNGSDRNGNIPADDPDDTSPADGVYILPTSDPSIEVARTGSLWPVGSGSSCPGTGNSGYAGAVYDNGGAWDRIGLRNSSGDAAQVRNPNGTYFHGFAYGNADMTGGPDNLKINHSTGTADVFFFDNGTDDDYRNSTNFVQATVGSGAESPGVGNSAANIAWINSLSNPCPLPVAYRKELEGHHVPGGNALSWTTAMELKVDRFELERSASARDGFETIAVFSAKGENNKGAAYDHLDRDPLNGSNFYRLVSIDMDGSESTSQVVEIVTDFESMLGLEISPNPANNFVSLQVRKDFDGIIEITDALGREVYRSAANMPAASPYRIELNGLSSGMHFVRMIQNGKAISKRFLVKN